jgi:outer membrane protein assembly factor BamB
VPARDADRSAQRALLHALTLADGSPRWHKSFEHASISGLATTADGLLLVALTSTDLLRGAGALVALDAAGEERWRSEPGGQRVSTPAISVDLAYITVDTRTLVTLDLASGEERSCVSLPASASLSAPALAGDMAIVPCRGPYLLAVGLDGTIHWQYTDAASAAWLDKTPLVVGDRIFAVSSGGTVIALGAEDGAQLWHTQVGPAGKSLTAPATDGARLFVGARDGLHALALGDGAQAWHFETARRIEAAPVVHAGVVYATCHDHHLYALDARSGKELWRYEVERRIEVPPVLAHCDGVPCAVIADRGGTVTAVARPLSATEHEAAGHWEEAAEAYAALGEPGRGAQLLQDHDLPLAAAELWMETGKPEHAAVQYEVAGTWRQAAQVWGGLGRARRWAEALEQHARSLEDAACSAQQRADAWAAAAQAFDRLGERERADACRAEVARHLRQPVIAVDVELDQGLLLNAWTRLRFIVRNEGHGPARNLVIRASGDEFEGQVTATRKIATLPAGEERVDWLDVRPREHGDSVPLRVRAEYQNRDGEAGSCEHTIHIPVARSETTRREQKRIPVPFLERPTTGGIPMSHSWNTAAVRDLLTAAFSDQEIQTLCFDYFYEVYQNLSGGMGKGEKIQRLLDYCQRHDRIEDLVTIVQEENPAQYARFEAELRRAPASSTRAGRGGPPMKPPQEPAEIRHRYALLVGVRDYVGPNYRPLPHTVPDVTELAAVLEAAGYTVRLLHSGQDEDCLKPTRENVWAELETLARTTGPGDLLLVHFGGHGDLDDEGRAYLLPQNGRKSSLRRTAIDLEEFKEVLSRAGAQAKVLVLDACHSGIGRDAAGMNRAFERHVYLEAQGTATLAACRHGEVAHEHHQSPHGAFTYYILDGLRGAAAGEGFVTFDALKDHVTHGVKQWALTQGLQQWPNAHTQVVGNLPLIEIVADTGTTPSELGG